MPYNAKNATLSICGRTMDYISFGSGPEPLVMLTGVGDGLKTVKGMALPFSFKYRAYARRHRVYVFSRTNGLEKGYTTREMARDVKLAMEQLGINGASVMGVSQGGMIAQYLALDNPDCVKKLVLAVTSARPGPLLSGVVSAWIAMAKRNDYRGIITDCNQRSYSEAYLRAHRMLLQLASLIGRPRDLARFMILAESCLSHDAYGRLTELSCPTLILGGGDDRILGAEASKEIAVQIRESELHIYEGLGHAAYDEAADFNARILSFLGRPNAADIQHSS